MACVGAGKRIVNEVRRSPTVHEGVITPLVKFHNGPSFLYHLAARRTRRRCCGRYGWTARQQRWTRWDTACGLRVVMHIHGVGALCEAPWRTCVARRNMTL